MDNGYGGESHGDGMRTALITTGLLAFGTPAFAQVSPPQVQASAGELVTLMTPSEPIIAALEDKYRQKYRSEWTAQGGAEEEEAFPGLLEHSMSAGTSAYRSVLERRFPDLRGSLQALLLSRLSEAEIRSTIAFLRSGAGQKALGATTGSLNAGRNSVEMEAAAKTRFTNDITTADAPAITQFVESGAAAKFAAIRVEFRPTIAAWSARANEEARPVIDAQVEAAATEWIKTHKKVTP